MMPFCQFRGLGNRGIASTLSSALVRSGSVPTQTLLPILLDIMPQGTDWNTGFEASSVTQSILDLCKFEVKNPNPYVQNRLPAVPSELTPLQRGRCCGYATPSTPGTWWMVTSF
jgi:hypothetical protein